MQHVALFRSSSFYKCINVLAILLISGLGLTTLAQQPTRIIISYNIDTFTIYIPDKANSVSLQSLKIEIPSGNSEPMKEDLQAYIGISISTFSAPICFELRRYGSQMPLSNDCKNIKLLSYSLQDIDVFWYDIKAKRLIDIGISSDAMSTPFTCTYLEKCELTFIPPTYTPTPTDPPNPTEMAIQNAQNFTGTSNGAWTPFSNTFDNVEMVLVPRGNFTMGSADGDPDEQPTPAVIKTPFWIDKYEVSRAQYGECVTEGECTKPSRDMDLTGDLPVTNITWSQTQTYCQWRGGDLPTEKQWEYAARGPEGWVYPWGNGFDTEKVQDNLEGGPASVVSHPDGKSWVGAFNMSGNVLEWTNTLYVEDYSDTAYLTANGVLGKQMVARGGSFGVADRALRASDRFAVPPTATDVSLGFRCARSING